MEEYGDVILCINSADSSLESHWNCLMCNSHWACSEIVECESVLASAGGYTAQNIHGRSMPVLCADMHCPKPVGCWEASGCS